LVLTAQYLPFSSKPQQGPYLPPAFTAVAAAETKHPTSTITASKVLIPAFALL
jgi:hypothetical protein